MNGPFQLDLKVRMTDGERTAIVTYNLPVGTYPTKERIQGAIAECLETTRKQAGKKFRLQTREEFENEVLSEKYGGMLPEFATKQDWDE